MASHVSESQAIVAQPDAPVWLTYDVPCAGLLFAFIAALFSLLSWQRMKSQLDTMKDQITLAEKQIKQQDNVIELTQQDIQLTEEALRIAIEQKQFADKERARSPELRILVNGTYPEARVVGNNRLHQEDDKKIAFRLNVELTNTGDAVASDILIEVVIPEDWDDNCRSAGMDDDHRFVFDREGEKVASRRLDFSLVPATSAVVGNIWASARPGRYQIHWMAKTGQGFFTFPAADQSGLAEFTIIVESPHR